MITTKKTQNVKIFAPKRKYNRPVSAIAIPSGASYYGKFNGIHVCILNKRKKTIYIRGE